MTPSGVVMASAVASTIEWVTWMNSMLEWARARSREPGFTLMQLDVLDGVFFQTPLDQRQRERRAVHRHVDFAQQERDRADVIFVAVRENQCPDVLAILLRDR